MKNCTGVRCILQIGTVDPATCDCVSFCPQATPPKTRADYIRAMTDEELAILIGDNIDCEICKLTFDPEDRECPRSFSKHIKNCADIWLNWLKQEVKE